MLGKAAEIFTILSWAKWEPWLIYPSALTLLGYTYLKESCLLLRGDRLTVC